MARHKEDIITLSVKLPARTLPHPIATLMLLAIIVAVGVAITLSPDRDALLQGGANDPVAVRQRGEVYRLLTSIFLHAGLWHLLLNANLLYIFGLSLERKLGHRHFLLVYFIGGLAGGIAHTLFGQSAGLGASGALYALLGADWMYLHYQRRTLTKPERLYLYFIVALGNAGLIIGWLIELGHFGIPVVAGNWAHLGGLLAGLVLGRFYIWRQRH
jgi:rhomboid protease GluP